MRGKLSPGRGIGVGMASVLMIVMVLALTAFGVLALASGRTQERQSARLQELTAAYYEAEARLSERLSVLDADLHRGLTPAEKSAGDGVWELEEEVREGQSLVLVVEKAPEGAKERYKVRSWQLLNTGK